MGLVGKFVIHSGPEFYQSGEVVEEVLPRYVLIRLDASPLPDSAGLHLVAVDSMGMDFDDENMLGFGWQFFLTRADLEMYLEWVQAPDIKRLKVVPLVQKQKDSQ